MKLSPYSGETYTDKKTGQKIYRSQSEGNIARHEESLLYLKISIGISVAALIVSAIFGVLDYFGDMKWQNEQLEVLQEIRDEISRQGDKDILGAHLP